jgi:Protein of unknown function (DUF3768)
MNIGTAERVATIAQLNDKLRTTFMGGKVLLTASVTALDELSKARLLKAICTFEAFNDGNNPHGERDFVSVDVGGEKYFAKIDCYAPDMEHGSEDPADPKKTVRVMTIMHASDY